MHPIQCRQFVFFQESRCSNVRTQHALLDDLVGIVALNRHYLFYLPVGVKHNLGFGGFEINCATLGTRLAQQLVETIKIVQLRENAGVLLAQLIALLGVRMLQHGTYLVVGKPRMTEHDRLIKVVAADVTGGANGHIGHHAEAIDARIQRAKAIGQLFWQHWHNVVGEINRRTAV